MMMTAAQKQTLKSYIDADQALTALRVGGNYAGVAAALNADASPDFWAYKTSVSNDEIGDAMNGTEVAGLSSLSMQRAQMLANYSSGFQNPSRADRRAAFNQIFSGAGGATTRAALDVLWRRRVSVVEKLFATGTGSTGSPATLATGADGAFLEGDVSANAISALWE